jgi:hypothetical protein
MRIHKHIAIAAALLVGTACARALEFNVAYIQTASEGGIVKRPYFPDGGQKLVFHIDGKTTVESLGYAAVFRFQGLDDALLRIGRSRSNPDIPFEAKYLDQYRLMARDALPQGAENITPDGEKADAFAINGWKSYQVALTFEVNHVAWRRTVTFVNYNDHDQIAVTIEAPLNAFPKAAERGWKIINSFYTVGDEEKAAAASSS